jgi:transcription antitermination factor NusG
MKTTCTASAWRRFELGTPIVVDEGPLQGLRGTVLGVDENLRLIVAMTLLRGSIPVALDPADVHCDDGTATGAPQLLTH